MKAIQGVLTFALVTFLSISAAMANGGAIVDRYTDEELGWFWWDGDQTLAMFSSNSEFNCNPDSETIYIDLMDVIRPDGSIMAHGNASFFIRVFYGVTPDDFFAGACELWNNGPVVAEGLIQSAVFNNNDANFNHPKRTTTWGFNMSGPLYDLTGYCPSGMVDLNLVRRAQWWWCNTQNCFRWLVINGPRLECVN